MIKQFFKKVLISYLIIICCIYTPTAQAAGWSFGGYNFGNGSLNITKNGVKITTAAVDSAPITSNLGAKILGGAIRGANVVTAISIIAGLGSDAIDWLLDPANNAIKYKDKTKSSPIPNTKYYYQMTYEGNLTTDEFFTAEQSAAYAARLSDFYPGKTFSCSVASPGANMICKYKGDVWASITAKTNPAYNPSLPADYYKTIPIPTVAQQILNNAKSGDTNAQADVISAVADLVNSGAYDTPINQAIQDAINNGTLPKDDTANPTDPTNPQIDTSSITAAIQSLASSFASAISNAFNGITSVINTSIDKLLNKQDQIQGELVNTGSKIDAVGGQVVGVGDKVDSVGGKVVGVGDAVKDVGGKVVGLNDSVDKVGDKVVGVGDKVTTTGDKVTDAVTGVGDKVTTTGDKVTDAVTGVGDKVTTTGEKTAEAIKESTKEITKKMDEAKPKDFELPAFCSWASKVCDFIDWVKKDPEQPQDGDSNLVEPDNEPSFNIDDYANKSYVQFSGECPAPPVFNIFGGQITFPMDIICKGCEQMSWVFVAFAWLRAVMIVFFVSKG